MVRNAQCANAFKNQAAAYKDLEAKVLLDSVSLRANARECVAVFEPVIEARAKQVYLIQLRIAAISSSLRPLAFAIFLLILLFLRRTRTELFASG